VIVRWSFAELPEVLAEAGIERPFLIRKEQLRTVGGGAPAVQLSETPG